MTILNISLFLLLIVFYPLFNFAQPSPADGELRFRIYSPDFGYISPDNPTFNVSIENQSITRLNEKITEKFYYSYEYRKYVFVPHKTPIGGLVSETFHIKITSIYDTMLIYSPLYFRYVLIDFDSIPFKAGKYYISHHIYYFDLGDIKAIPDIIGNWDLFKEPAPSVFLELTDTLPKSEDKILDLNRKTLELNQIINAPKKSYQYGNLLLVNECSDIFTIYKIKEIVDSTLFGGNIYDFLCDTIIYKNGGYYAIGVRQFGGGANTHCVYGIFKLHFDKNITQNDTICLTYKYYLVEGIYMEKAARLNTDNTGYLNEYGFDYYIREYLTRLNNYKRKYNIKRCF